MSWTFIIISCLICGAISAAIGQRKNLGVGESFAWGALLGIIGIIVVIASKPGLPKAPEGMRAVKCPRCNAVQNVSTGAATFNCWQCQAEVPAPAPSY